MAFDPDEFLKSSEPQPSAFDPDKFLQDTAPKPDPTVDRLETLHNTSSDTPENAARFKQLADSSGVTYEVAKAIPDKIEADSKRIDWKAFTSEAPKVAKHLADDPVAFDIAKYDIGSLKKIEQSKSLKGLSGDIGIRLAKGVSMAGQSVIGMADLAQKANPFTSVIDLAMQRETTTFSKMLADAGISFNDANAAAEWLVSDASKQASAEVSAGFNDGIVEGGKAILANPSYIAEKVAQSTPQMLVAMAAVRQQAAKILTTGGPEALKAAMPQLARMSAAIEGAQSAGNYAGEKAESGDLTSKQQIAAVGQGLTTMAFGMLSNKFGKAIGIEDAETAAAAGLSQGGGFAGWMKRLTGTVVKEGPVEEGLQSTGEQMWQNFGDGKDLFQGVGQAFTEGSIIGTAQGGGLSAFNDATGTIINTLDSKKLELDSAERNIASVNAELSAIGESKLLQTSPKTLHQLMDVMDGDEKQDLYIDPAELFQGGVSKDAFLQAVPGAAQEIADAEVNGGVIKVSRNELLVGIKAANNPEMEAEVVRHIKVDAKGRSMAELEAEQGNLSNELQDLADKAVSQFAEESKGNQDLQDLLTVIKDDLKAAGAPKVNESRAMLWASLANAQGKASGQSAMDVYKQQFRGKVSNESLGGDVFNQQNPFTPENGFDTVEEIDFSLPEGFTSIDDGSNVKPSASENGGADGKQPELDEFGDRRTNPDDKDIQLSNFPKARGWRVYDKAQLLEGIRLASDKIRGELGRTGSSESQATRELTSGPLGPFTSSSVSSEIKGDRLFIYYVGQEQAELGLTDEAALTVILNKTGELVVNGPPADSATFEEFKKLGWADFAEMKGGEKSDYWTSLTGFEGLDGAKGLLNPGTAAMLADAHARLRAWRGEDKVLINWVRYTGATGNALKGRKGVAFFQSQNQTETTAFKKWFGDSKVVDADGKPLVVYHGTNADFSVFQNQYAGKTWEMFSDSSEYSNRFAHSRGGVVMPVYLSFQNPLDLRSLPAIRGDVRNKLIELLDDAGVEWSNSDLPYERDLYQIINMAGHKSGFADNVKKAGFDSIIMPDNHDGDYLDDGGIIATTYIALDPAQIKSAIGNNGAFDSNDPSILNQEARGAFNPQTRDIALFAQADLSTFLHETGHLFLEIQMEMAAAENASERMVKDADNVLKWFGIKGETVEDRRAAWSAMSVDQQRQYHEKYAESFEQYLFEGKAPSVELRDSFRTFRQWLTHVYKSISKFLLGHDGAKLNDEVRGIFDRMLATEEQIKQAEDSSGLYQFFTEKPEGLSQGEWDNYLRAVDEATQSAVDQLQSRSIRDLKWAAGAQNKALKALQRQAKSERRIARMDARKAVLSRPEYRAWQFLTAPVEGVEASNKKAKASAEVEPHRDSLFTAIAKLGGLNKDQAVSQYGIDPKDFHNRKGSIVGKPVLRATGGLSPDAMAEALSQFGYMKLDDNGKWDILDLDDMLRNEAAGDLVYSQNADYDLLLGKPVIAPNAEDVDFMGGRLSRQAIREMYDDADLAEMQGEQVDTAGKLMQFAGVNARTAMMDKWIDAKEMVAKGIHAEKIRRDTGWFMGVDGKWRFEISDDEARMIDPPIYEAWENYFDKKEKEKYGPSAKPSEFPRKKWLEYLEFRGDAQSEYDNRNSRRSLEYLLDHPKLYEAYPDLKNLLVSFVSDSDYRGMYSSKWDEITLKITNSEEDMLSVLLHEIQHAIQQREDFAKGGNHDASFTSAVKDAIGSLANKSKQDMDQWAWANKYKIDDSADASRVARFGLMYESAQRLIDYSKRDKPSGVLRLIRNEMQWVYNHDLYKDNDKARELSRAWYDLPKPHKMAKRNAFLSNISFDAGQFLLEQIPEDLVKQFKSDTRTMKGMLKSLERTADRKRADLQPLRDLEKKQDVAETLNHKHIFSTPYQIYRALAGEVEARNTQARQKMTADERIDQSPASTQDVRAENIIVMFGGMDIQAPISMMQSDSSGLLFQPAYHGTPYKFDKFSLEHMGKGEGAQAYGWGLYFAGSKDVAEYYRDTLAGRNAKTIDGVMDSIDLANAIRDRAYKINPDIPEGMSSAIKSKAAEVAQSIIYKNKTAWQIVDEISQSNFARVYAPIAEAVKELKPIQDKGQLYKVDIPEDDSYLLWDRPLSAQPKKVRDAINSLHSELKTKATAKSNVGAEPTGSAIYGAIQDYFAGGGKNDVFSNPANYGQKEASMELADAGISGIKYLDGSSRGKGEGDYNYVIFDDNAVQILETYYQKGGKDKGGNKLDQFLSDDGLHPDVVADLFGFSSGDELIKKLASAPDPVSEIERLTDQFMVERHADLASPEAMQEAALDAVHNKARARMVATELAILQKAMGSQRMLVKQAKAYADRIVGKTTVRDLKPARYEASEAKAAKEAVKLQAQGKTKEAAIQLRNRVLHNATATAVRDANTDVEKARKFFAKIALASNEKNVKRGRDADVVNAINAVLAQYGFSTKKEKTALEYLSIVEQYDPEMAGFLKPIVDNAMMNAKNWQTMSFDEFMGMRDEIDSLWYMAKRSRQMEVDGKRLDLDEASAMLMERMQQIGIPQDMPGKTSAITPKESAMRSLQYAGALLRRVEQWAEAKDGKFGGAFLRLIFQPVKIAADSYRRDRAIYRKKFTDLAQSLPDMKRGTISAPELDYVFGNGDQKVGMAELLHAVLHTGNESNKRKLLLGGRPDSPWASLREDGTLDTGRWDAFMARAVREGLLTKAHFDFAQGIWDLLEETKPLAQKTHREVFGRYFDEVSADQFGIQFPNGEIVTYRGGYVPAQVDSRLVNDAAIRELVDSENQNMAYSFPATSKGFTKARVEYNRPLLLNISSLTQHMDKVLLFSHMEPAVRDVNRLLKRTDVSEPLSRIDPAAYSGMLLPWLNRAARQSVETPITGDGGMARLLSGIRNRSGMGLMFGNISNTLQQITGVSNALTKVKGSHLRRAVAAYIASPREMAERVSASSDFMRNRMDNEIAAITEQMNLILLDPTLFEKSKEWTQKHAYFLQSAFDNVVSTVVWTGAYNQAVTEGMTEMDAGRFADGVVRQTQGTTLPEDVSRIETGPAYARVFTQFIGYFNMLANTNATELQKIAQDVGLKKGAGRALGVFFYGVLAPAWIAEAISLSLRGGPEDDDDDGYLDDWLSQVIGMGTLKMLLAGVPFVGQFANAGIARFNGNPLDDRVSLSPAVSLLESGFGAPYSVYKAIVDDGDKRKAVRDVATLLTLATGLPFIAAARPVGYLAAVADDKVEPTNVLDFARGTVTGVASPQSK